MHKNNYYFSYIKTLLLERMKQLKNFTMKSKLIKKI